MEKYFKEISDFIEDLEEKFFQMLLDKSNREKVKEFCKTLDVKKTVRDVYPVLVNYKMSLRDMVKAGDYDWPNADINAKNFPTMGSGKKKVGLQLIHLNEVFSSKDALVQIEDKGLRPANLAELLAFGAKYPEVQRNFPIIAFGSSHIDSDGVCYVPYLRRGKSKRRLSLRWLDRDWHKYCRFLAVRKAL